MTFTIEDIVSKKLCTGCGICISESETSRMVWDEEGFLVPLLDDSFNSLAVKICPFNPNPEKEVYNENVLADLFLNEATNRQQKIGKYINTYVGFSKEYRPTSSSGGIATYVFEKLLTDKIVDHIFIVKEVDGKYEYQLFNDVSNIVEISKTKYTPVTLEKLFIDLDSIKGKVAVSGIACFIKAIRLKQFYYPEYKEKIPFLIGIICGGLKSNFFTDYLAQKAEIKSTYSKQDYRIKNPKSQSNDYSFGAYDSNQEFKQVRMQTIGDMWGTGMFKSNACDFCDDVTTELADISLGDAWIHPFTNDGLGNSIVVTRSTLAENIIQKGIEIKDLRLQDLSLNNFLASQQGSFNHRHTGLSVRLNWVKKENKSIMPPKRYENEKVTIDFKMVQKQRMKVRAKSLEIWRNNPDANFFDKTIEKHLKKLRFLTKIYHKRRLLIHKKNRLIEIVIKTFFSRKN